MKSRVSQVALLFSPKSEDCLLNHVNRLTLPESREVFIELGAGQHTAFVSGNHFYFWNWREWDLAGAFVETISTLVKTLPHDEFKFIRVGSSWWDSQQIGTLEEAQMANGLCMKTAPSAMPLRFKERKLFKHTPNPQGRLEIILALEHSLARQLSKRNGWESPDDAELAAFMRSSDACLREEDYRIMYWHSLPEHTYLFHFERLIAELIDWLDSPSYRLLLINHHSGTTLESGSLQTGIDGFHIRKLQSITF